MSGQPIRVVLLLALCGTVVGLASRARAQQTPPFQEGEPIIIGEEEVYDPWELDSFGAAINTEARFHRFRRSTAGQPDQVDTERYLLGRLDLSGRAFIGHENLIDLDGRVGIGWEETDFDSDIVGASQTDSGLTYLYDVSALILRDGPAPVTVYSRREEQRLEREFSGSIDGTTEEHGAMARIQSEDWPTFIHVYRRESEQQDRLGQIDYGLRQDSLNIRTSPELGENQELTLEYALDLVDEHQNSSFRNSFTRHDAQAVHTINFGVDNEHSLRSTARFYDESGLADLRRYRLDEVLRLKHTEDFDTRWDAIAEENTRSDQWQRFVKAQGQARYKLFESVVAIATLGVDRLDVAGGFNSTQYFGDAQVEYTKRVPLGRLFASAGAGANRQENSEQGTPLLIADQRVTLTDPQPALINRRNVVDGSLLVTNADGTRIYVEGLDYTVSVFPSHVEIRRVVGGAIAEGETVLVDYTVGPEPASTIDSVSTNFGVRYSLEEGKLQGLGAFLNYTTRDQSVDAVDPSRFILDDSSDLRYGVEYHRFGITLEAERRHHDSTIFPYDTTRLEARYDTRAGPLAALSAGVTHDITDYPDTGDRLQLTRATIRISGRVGDGLDISGRVIYRDERSQLSSDLAGFEQAIDVTWRKGRTTVTGSLFNGFLDAEATDSISQTISVGVRRTF